MLTTMNNKRNQSGEQQIRALIKTIQTSHIILNEQEKNVIKSASFYPNQKYINQLQVILESHYFQNKQKCKTTPTQLTSYPGNLNFNKFEKTNHLHVVCNTDGKNDLFFYFDKAFITDFEKLPVIDQQKFQLLGKKDHVKIAAGKNEQGIKYLKYDKSLPKCHLRISEFDFITKLTHELKIKGSSNRISILTLKPITKGPQILIATHAIQGGFHSGKKTKLLTTKRLELSQTKAHIRNNPSSFFSELKMSSNNQLQQTDTQSIKPLRSI